MPWSTSDRRSRLGPDWHARRARCYRNAGGRCQHVDDNGQRCTTRPPLHKTTTQAGGHADHIDRELGEDGPLAWLCPAHHYAKSSAEGHDAMRQQRAKTLHPRERHPGLN